MDEEVEELYQSIFYEISSVYDRALYPGNNKQDLHHDNPRSYSRVDGEKSHKAASLDEEL